MTISAAGFTPFQYKGTPYPIAVQLAGIGGRVVPFRVDWATYGAPATSSIVVNCNLQAGNQGYLIPKIRSIFIDNLNSETPVFVQFEDTLDTIVAAPNTKGWYPVVTNLWNFEIFATGFSSPPPITTVYASDIPVRAFTDIQISPAQWLASAQVSRGGTFNNANYGVPALGDQTCSPQINNFNPLQSDGLFLDEHGALIPANFYYLTAMQLTLTQLGATNAGAIEFVIKNTQDASSRVWQWDFAYPTTANGLPGNLYFPPITGLQLKLDGSKTWILVVSQNTGNISGSAIGVFAFTTNPI